MTAPARSPVAAWEPHVSLQPGDELPQGEVKRRAVRQMFDSIAARYQLVNTLASFGLDRGWRKRCLEALDLAPGSRVLDVACGTGELSRELVHRGQLAVGLDLSPAMLATGALAHAPSTPLVLGDALSGPFVEGSFDGAVSGFALRNVVDLGQLCAELGRLVHPGGRICLLDLATPQAPLLRWGHHLWSNWGVPLLGAILSDRDAYRYLPRSFAYLPAPDRIVELLRQGGFVAVEHELLSGGIAQLFVATRGQDR